MALRTGDVCQPCSYALLGENFPDGQSVHGARFSSHELSRPTRSLVVEAHRAITPRCSVHMRPVGAGSCRQTTDGHHLGLQMRLQLLLCFRSLSCRVDRAWTAAYPLVYQSGCTLISAARESESEGTAQRSGLRLRPDGACQELSLDAAWPMSREGAVCAVVGHWSWPT